MLKGLCKKEDKKSKVSKGEGGGRRGGVTRGGREEAREVGGGEVGSADE